MREVINEQKNNEKWNESINGVNEKQFVKIQTLKQEI